MIQQIPLLENIDMSDINYHIKDYADKNMIIQAGEKSTHYAILLKGQAVMQYINEQGQLMTIATFKKGETFGGNRLFCNNNHYPMTITSKGQSQILYIDKLSIIELCHQDKKFLIHFLRDVADKSDILSKNIRALKFITIEKQIINRLAREKQKHQSCTFTMTISKKEWAENLGISRTSLSRTLQNMYKKGWIEYKNRSYKLLEPERFTVHPSEVAK